jgi:hypothetical protein
MSEDEDRSKPLSINEIVTEAKKKSSPSGRIPLPFSVGNSGGRGDKAMSGQRTYSEIDDEDIPNGGVIGARISNNERR